MIRVVRAAPTGVPADAVMRSVGADLEACTAVCGAIGIEAGEELLERLRGFGEIPVGGAIVTPGGRLRSAYLIHVVLRSREEPITMESVAHAFRNGLRQAAEWQVDTLAVPALGTGAGNLDAEVAAAVMFSVLHRHEGPYPREVVVTVASEYEEEAFRAMQSRPTPPPVPGGASIRAVDALDESDMDDWMTALDRYVGELDRYVGGEGGS